MTSALAFADLVKQKRKLEAELKQLNELIWQEEQALLEEFAERGITSERLEDGRTVFRRRQLWARAVGGDKHRTCEALVADPDFADVVEIEANFNVHTLSKRFRDKRKELDERKIICTVDDLVPESLKPYIALTEDIKLGVSSG